MFSTITLSILVVSTWGNSLKKFLYNVSKFILYTPPIYFCYKF